MPCPIYDGLMEEWRRAVHAYTLALDPGVRAARSQSAPKRIAEEQAKRRELRHVEWQLNTHIPGCATCLSERHKPGFNVSELHE
jgi:hypothetical protein